MKNQEQKTDPKKTAEQLKGTVTDKTTEAIKSMNLEDKIDLERREAYIEPQTRDLLRKLLQDGDKVEIIPIYTPGIGFEYRITGTVSNINETDKLSRNTLENLAQLGILQKSFYDSVSICPTCQSTMMTLHNRCPNCKSHNVEKTSLTEHILCGYIDQRDKYIQDRCPKCGESLVEGQYRNMGRWYICQECGEKFENPEFDLICRNCNKNFTIKEAQLTEIPKFTLNLTRKKEIRQNVTSLENIKTLLTKLDFSVETPGLIIGQKSGMNHHFSLIAKKQIKGQEIFIALDHAVSETEIPPSPLILYIYKISEVKVDVPIFVAMPQLSETARKIAQGYNILIIEGSTEASEVIDKVKTEIEDRINQINQKTTTTSENQQPENKAETTSFFSKLKNIKKKNITQRNNQNHP
jgi:predicted RNA-binding Zn-ribbon protein involved in translation (DUF1610 family)